MLYPLIPQQHFQLFCNLLRTQNQSMCIHLINNWVGFLNLSQITSTFFKTLMVLFLFNHLTAVHYLTPAWFCSHANRRQVPMPSQTNGKPLNLRIFQINACWHICLWIHLAQLECAEPPQVCKMYLFSACGIPTDFIEYLMAVFKFKIGPFEFIGGY